MAIAVLGIDLGKNSCSAVGLDRAGRVIVRRRLRRLIDFLLTAKRDLGAARCFFGTRLQDEPLRSPDRIGTVTHKSEAGLTIAHHSGPVKLLFSPLNLFDLVAVGMSTGRCRIAVMSVAVV